MIIPTKNKQEGKNMIGMFWAEKYAMAAGLTMVIRKMFGCRGTKDMWVSALTAGTALVSMNLGAGLLNKCKIYLKYLTLLCVVTSL